MEEIKIENLLIKAEKSIKRFFRILGNNKLKIFLVILGVALFGGTIFATGGGFFKVSSPASVAAKGLVGYWPLDSASMKNASTTADMTPNANDGTLYGRALANRLTTDRKMVANAAMSFDGVNDYAQVVNDSSLNFGLNSFTVSYWLNFDVGSSQQRWSIGKGNPYQSGGPGWSIGHWTTGDPITPVLYVSDGTGAPTNYTVNFGSMSRGTWYQLLFVVDRDNGLVKTYLNNVYKYQLNISSLGSFDSLGNLLLGTGNDSSGNKSDGSISDVRIYNYALSQAEITKLYDDYKPKVVIDSLEKGLVGHWPLDSASMKSASTTADLTPYGNDGTLYGRALADRLTTDRKMVANGAMSFNGVNDSVDMGNIPFNQTFSISLWLKPLGYATSWRNLVIGRETYLVNGFRSGLDTSGKYIFWSSQSGGTLAVTSNTVLPLNQFTHVVMVYNGTNGSIYINGLFDKSGAGTYNYSSNSIIMAYGMGLNTFNGSTSDVRIYNRALSQAEITRLYDNYKPKVVIDSLNKGLVGYWPLDSKSMKSASTTADLTPYGNDGTLYGRALADRLTTDRKQVANGAMGFNGVADYMDAGNGASVNITDAITVSTWVKPPAVELVERFVLSKTAAYFLDAMRSWSLYPHFYIYIGGSANGLGSNTKLTAGIWNHLVGTYNSADKTMRIYVNGKQTGTNVLADNYKIDVYGITLRIGSHYNASYFNGSISDVRIYNRALSADEVRMLYERY